MVISELKLAPNKEYERLDTSYIEKIIQSKAYKKFPILITKDNVIIDGYHRYFAAKRNFEKEIDVIKFNITFEESAILRDFDKDIKRLIREFNGDRIYYTSEERLKEICNRYKKIIPWIRRNL